MLEVVEGKARGQRARASRAEIPVVVERRRIRRRKRRHRSLKRKLRPRKGMKQRQELG